MKILYFTSPVEDYLGDAILIGLRERFGADCIDFPKNEILYDTCPEHIHKQVRGNGFTLYTGLLSDIAIDRFNIEYKLQSGHYDWIIFSDIQRQFGLFVHFRPWLNKRNTIVMDGFDTSQPYPARGRWWRKPYYWFLPSVHRSFLYFKREWTNDTHFNMLSRFLPSKLRASLPPVKNLRPIAFSIPKEKIIAKLPVKQKDFPKHIVDEELAKKLEGAHTTYTFDNEADYYHDLQESRFGITTKRAGWDCLRHYEIAANGAVICFKDLDKKPVTCAPHGLVDGENCIAYSHYNDLMERISGLSTVQYKNIQQKCWEWAFANTCDQRVAQLLSFFEQR